MATSCDGKNILTFVNVDNAKEEHLRRAANAASLAKINVLWIRPVEILGSHNLDKNSVFILQEFQGDHFEYLKSQKCRLFGPQCVLSCLQTSTPFPFLSYPVFTISMNGVFACCSSIAKRERQQIHDKICLMGGVVMRDFTDAVTHLIAGEVGSKKYAFACSLGKSIMMPEWVSKVWEAGRTKHVSATDKEFDKYKCPIFKGCTICITGLDGPTRQEIKRLCQKNGGVYSGVLSMDSCTHLLVNMPRGEKYEFARKWNIHCVSTQWFYDCLKSGFWLDETSYCILPDDETCLSPPGSRINLSATTNVSQVSSKSRTERLSTTAAQAAYKSAKTHGDRGLIIDEIKKKRIHDESSRDLSNRTIGETCMVHNIDLDFTIEPGCMFLDGCKIFLSGCSGALLDKIRKLINVGGGTRFSMINENVSHVVIGSVVTKDVEALNKSEFHPYVVTVHWIIDSAKNGKRMSEEDYVHPKFKLESNESTPGSKSHKQGKKTQKPKDDDDLNDDEVFHQYSCTIEEQMPNGKAPMSSKSGNETIEDEEPTFDNQEEKEQHLLSEKSFIIKHFSDEQAEHLKQLIEEYGGRVAAVNNNKLPDFVVLPMNAECDSNLAKTKVTFCWLEQCIQEGKIFEPSSNFLFKPFTIPNGVSPLKDCVIAISQYLGVERDHLMQLAELLGANCQEVFVYKANRRYLASTHLLCREPEGIKYNAALKRNIPVVTCEWLFACAKSGSLQTVEDFLLGLNCKTIQTKTSTGIASEEPLDQNLKNPEGEGGYEKKRIEMENYESEGHNAQISESRELEIVTKLPSLSSKKPFRPSFDVSDAMQALESPILPNARSRKSRSSRNSLALDGLFEEKIIQAVQRTGNLGSMPPSSTKTHKNDKEVTSSNDRGDTEVSILHGATVAVSKKLSQQQAELCAIAASLGADYHLLYDTSCTHLIHQGKANDNSKDFNLAKEHGKYIVSPHWLHACAEAKSRLDENLYPHIFNPKLSLQGVTKERTLTRASKAALDVSVNEDTPITKPEAASKTDEPTSEDSKVSFSTDTNSNHSEESKEYNKDSKEMSQNSKLDSERSDLKEDLQKQIDNFISANKGNRNRRRSRRQNSCSGPGATPINSAGQSYDGANRSRLSSQNVLSRFRTCKNNERDFNKLGDDNSSIQKPLDDSEYSQSDHITYDDPAGRLEREKIMARLKRGCSPSPDDFMETCDENVEENNDDCRQEYSSNEKQKIGNPQTESSSLPGEKLVGGLDNIDDSESSQSTQSTQTPVPPPLTIQLKDVEKPTPQNLLEELETSQDKPRETLKFQLSAMTPQEKIDFAALIEELGGQVFDTQYFKPDCSHVVVGKPNRNEKYLAAIAAGKWVLHKSFLEDSRQVGHFVNEEPHEWGTEVTGGQSNKLARAAKRWRVKLKEQRRVSNNPSIGAFSGWRTLLCVDKQRQPGFKRLLEAGGAQVAGSRPPFNNIVNVTHAFIDSSKVKPDTIDIEALHSAGIWLVKPDYIAEFLMQDPEPHPGRYLVPEAVALREEDRSDTSYQRKRKGDEIMTDEKRARIE